ncbi:HisA/HisF-related TIM barrel protein [Paraburkholderia sp. GAS42]|jgi:uncharacterized protein related to proFAR isomerase|uniref:HisA/HisF-related TIM barrel protein n=1 Tax=Paraburkholderia sp. GAS42 TaxID=3035135 RepID=UPI003D25820C
MMQIIPVIDVLDGAAVRAVRGERSLYRPVESQLCRGSDPVDVARALLDYTASSILYVADLDGIMRGKPQRDALMRLALAVPGIELWIDAGFAGAVAAYALIAPLDDAGANVTPVFGSESLVASATQDALRYGRSGSQSQSHSQSGSLSKSQSPSGQSSRTAALPEIVNNGIPYEAILSLDRRHDAPLGDITHWTDASGWPSRVIVMSLERVGSFDGPDLAAIADVQRRAGTRQIIGAGGVRDTDDLRAAEAAGAHAWLIASALHDRRIPAASNGTGSTPRT